MFRFAPVLFCTLAISPLPAQDELWLELPGAEDLPGSGRSIVLVSGDEEYRSEEALPQLGAILATRHGFDCRVCFAIDPETGTIDPDVTDNIPGLEALADADLLILQTRFRNLPDEQMRHIVAYLERGGPVLGLRTATHAFNIPEGGTYSRYSWQNKDWPGGFGRQVLGETWIAHHGKHGSESTRGQAAAGQGDHPILRGCEDIWGDTDVYRVRLPLPEPCTPLLLGIVLEGMEPDDQPAADDPRNEPAMPVAWTSRYRIEDGPEGRVFTCTMGASRDLLSEGLRRLLVNASYWALDLEDQIPERSDVDLVGDYAPTPFGFGKATKGVRPADLRR